MLHSEDTDWLNGYRNKTHTHTCCPQETHFRSKDTYKLKGMEKVFHTDEIKQAGIAILIAGKIDFKIKNVMRQKRTVQNNQD